MNHLKPKMPDSCRCVQVALVIMVALALSVASRAAERQDFVVGAEGNSAPRGMWGNGEVLWVTDYLDSKLYAYDMVDRSRLASRDIETRVGDTRNGARYPTDVWSDGETAWVSDNEFDRVYAYRLSDGTPDPDRDLELAATNNQPTGIWGDGETLWVTDKGQGKVYAYAMAGGSRVPARDFDLAGPDGATLAWAWGLWADDITFRVVDYIDRRVYAYRDGARTAGEDVENLRRRNQRPSGLWSNGTTLWVSDYSGQAAKLYSYDLPSPSSNATLVLLRLSGIDLGRFSPTDLDYAGTAPSEMAVATLTAFAAEGADVSVEGDDADAAEPGHQVALAYGMNRIALTVTAADGATSRSYAVEVMRLEPASSDATLSALSVSGVDIGTFSRATTSYSGSVAHDVASTTVTASANDPGATVSIADAQGSTAGSTRTVSLVDGSNEIAVTATAEDGTTTTYTVTVTRASPPPLTASWEDVPESHDGSSAFRLTLRFSEGLKTRMKKILRDERLEVTNGTVEGARRVNGSRAVWSIKVEPSGRDDTTVTLPADDTACDAGGVCTADGRRLSEGASTTIPVGVPPVAHAGWDLRVAAGELAYLDGTASTGDGGMTWSWSIDSWPGSTAPTLADAADANPSFVPAETGTYSVRLVVTHGGGTASDTVTVTAVPSSESGSLTQADLVADANRNGTVDAADDAGEDAWDADSGAVFAPNLDDDDEDGVRDGYDSVVNGTADLDDMTPIVLRRMPGLNWKHGIVVEMVDAPSGDWPQVFLERDGGFELLIGDGRHEAALAAEDLVAADAQLHLDSPYGRHVDFDGDVRLRASVVEGTTTVSEDEIVLRGSPILFSHHMQAVERVYVVNTADNEPLVSALRSHLAQDVDLYEIGNGLDRWVQDVMQTGYTQRSKGNEVGTSRTHANVSNGNRADRFLAEDFLAPGAGYGEPGGRYFPTMLNLGGNIELIPPHAHNGRSFPYGRLLIGRGMADRPMEFFEAQGLQTPAIEVEVGWLHVGHVDEVVQIVRDRNAGPGDRGWVVAIGSPDLAIEVLEQAERDGYGGAAVFANRAEETTVEEILADTVLMDFNETVQTLVNAIRDVLIDEVGLTEEDFRDVPAMWHGGLQFAESYFPNIQNLLVANGGLFLADPEGPSIDGVDIWRRSAEDAFDDLGYDIHFVDIYESYHLRRGAIHCGTNVEHTGTGSAWWLVGPRGGEDE